MALYHGVLHLDVTLEIRAENPDAEAMDALYQELAARVERTAGGLDAVASVHSVTPLRAHYWQVEVPPDQVEDWLDWGFDLEQE